MMGRSGGTLSLEQSCKSSLKRGTSEKRFIKCEDVSIQKKNARERERERANTKVTVGKIVIFAESLAWP